MSKSEAPQKNKAIHKQEIEDWRRFLHSKTGLLEEKIDEACDLMNFLHGLFEDRLDLAEEKSEPEPEAQPSTELDIKTTRYYEAKYYDGPTQQECRFSIFGEINNVVAQNRLRTNDAIRRSLDREPDGKPPKWEHGEYVPIVATRDTTSPDISRWVISVPSYLGSSGVDATRVLSIAMPGILEKLNDIANDDWQEQRECRSMELTEIWETHFPVHFLLQRA